MAQTSVDIPQLKFNKMSTAKYNELKEAGQLVENEFYITPDGGTIPEVNTDTNQQVLSNDGTNLSWRNEQVGYNQITNCITEIPQDIKLEINNGTITLKAGSKVYNGNGVLKTTTTDISSINANYDGQVLIALSKDFDVLLTGFVPGETVSELPISTASFKIYYNTTDKKCYLDTTDGWQECSLPIALGTSTVSSWVSIDQVFNGFGFIGSTIFALPGIKGLVGNEKNSFGTNNNELVEINEVLTATRTWNGSPAQKIAYIVNPQEGTLPFWFWDSLVISKYEPYAQYTIWYNPDTNITKIYNALSGQGSWVNCKAIFLGMVGGETNTSKVTSFSFKTCFQAIDINDTAFIAQQAMPSEKYINLGLDISETVYTAVANGYIQLVKQATAPNQYLAAYDTNLPSTTVDENTIAIKWSTSGVNDVLYFPVRKGQQFKIGYTFGGQTIAFRLILTQGE